MVAVKAGEAARALAKPDARWRVFLIYGPDSGLVSERVAQIVASVLGDAPDPFQLVRIDGDDVSADPLRLADEANTIGLFGGQRVIRVSRTSRSLADALGPVLSVPPDAAFIVIEAGELTPKSPLRQLCERSPHAAAIPCYTDEARGLGDLVDGTLRAEGLTIDRDARETLLASLGSDRLLSRQELQKLVLYVGSNTRIGVDDVDAVVGDSAVREMDAVVDAVLSGQLPMVEIAWAKLRQEHAEPTVIAGALLRQMLSLLQARFRIEDGQSVQVVVDSMRMSFTRKPAVQTALRNWSAAQLLDGVGQLANAIADARKSSSLNPEIIHRCLVRFSRRTRQR